MKCPRCHDPDLVDDGGGPLSSATCPRCGGGLVPDVGLGRLLEELGHTVEELRELAKLFGGARLSCPSCKSKMSPLVLRGAQLDLCFGCGSLWVDAGDLEAVSGGRYTMPAPTAPRAKATPTIVPAQSLVRVDERSVPRHVTRAVLSAVGAVGIVWWIVGMVPFTWGFLGAAALAAAARLSRRRAFDVLPRARRMMRWEGYLAPIAREGAGEVFSPESCVVVRGLRLGRRDLSWSAIDLVDPEGRVLTRLRGPLPRAGALAEAPRYGRALGLPVRFDLDPAADDALDEEGARRTDLPELLRHDLVVIAPAPFWRARKMTLKDGAGVEIGGVATEVQLKGKPENLDELLAEHFVVHDVGGKMLRLFSTTQLRERATVLVGPDGRVVGHVSARRNLLADVFTFSGPQARRRVTARLSHGRMDARVVDAYGRTVAVLEASTAGGVAEPRVVTLHAFPGRFTGDARWGLVALALHVSLAAAVPDL